MESKSYIKYVTLFNELQISKKWIEYNEFVERIYSDLRVGLFPFLPENALDEVIAMIKKYTICVHIETPRKGCHGQYRKAVWNANHIISINNNLDKNTFLYVFIHEYAHLIQDLIFLCSPVHGYEFCFCLNKLKNYFVKKQIINSEYGFDKYPAKDDKFFLRRIHIGVNFKYKEKVYTRGMGKNKKIHCKLLSDNAILELEPNTLVESVLDLQW